MSKEFVRVAAATLALAAALVIGPALSQQAAPMPQTKGMQGMDPKQHDQVAPKPYEGCAPSAQKAAQQAEHPMPQTKGMQGMDPKAHAMDCQEAAPREQPAHVHKN